MEFSDRQAAETREISENVYVDLDADGNLVAMTIEHARAKANLRELTYQQVGPKSA
jgi:uncharacterized protein YuzE